MPLFWNHCPIGIPLLWKTLARKKNILAVSSFILNCFTDGENLYGEGEILTGHWVVEVHGHGIII